MLRNYVKIALRQLRKHKAFAFINIAGLAIGIACCLLILLYVRHEFSYDRFHPHADRIYRVTTDLHLNGNEMRLASTMIPLAPALGAEFPEVERAVRIGQFSEEMLISHGDRRFYEAEFFFADSTLFDFFAFPLLHGDPATALAFPGSVVLTEEMARKYFGDADAVGKTLTVERVHELRVTGVLKEIPTESHLRPAFIAPLADVARITGSASDRWNSISEMYTYVRLAPGAEAGALEAKLPDLIDQYAGEGSSSRAPSDVFTLRLQPLTQVHLYSQEYGNNVGAGGDARYLYVFICVAVLILLIACINFMNLATARSVERAKEVGMRKVLGAQRREIARQFLGESVLLAVLALLVALALAELLLPVFNTLTARTLATDYGRSPALLTALVGIVLFVGAVAGSYPALFLSGFRPVEVLKGKAKGSRAAVRFRQVLVVLQFSISTGLMIGAGVMSAQMAFFRETDLGFDEEQVVVVPLRDPAVQARYEAVKQSFGKVPGVRAVAASSSTPGMNSSSISGYRPEGGSDDESMGLYEYFIDTEVIGTLGMRMAAGRGFSAGMGTDSSAYVLNETAVERLGWTDAVGKRLTDDDGNSGEVIGVVQDFHYISLDTEIPPMVLRINPSAFSYVSVRLAPESIQPALARLEQAWAALAPGEPFEYSFMDQDYERQYEAVSRLTRTIRAFTVLAVLVACLGMFGLATFSVEQRTKEIGVRKVLGASVRGIVVLLARDFLKHVLLAFLLAVPVAWYLMSRWLEEFAYRVDLEPGVFLLAGGLALLIAFLTVSFQTVRAALADPVRSLRYE